MNVALFLSSKDDTKIEVEMTNGECTAPNLSETAVKTSSSDSDEIQSDTKQQPSASAVDVEEIEATLAVSDSTDSGSVK